MIEVLIGERRVSTGNSLGIEAVSLQDQEADHVQKDRPTHLRKPRDGIVNLTRSTSTFLAPLS